MEYAELKDLLETKAIQYNRSFFIDSDPVQIPHIFNKDEDIELSGFFTAIMAWGQRQTIIRKSYELMEHMDMNPAEFIKQASETDLKRFDNFTHRTFNSWDCRFFYTQPAEYLQKIRNSWQLYQ